MRWRPARCPARTCSSRGDAAFKAVADRLLRQFAADEDKPTLARLAVLPFALVIALQHHVHALENVAVVVIGEGENALRAKDLLALGCDQVLQPWHELCRVERLVGLERQGLHVLVVIMLQAVAVIMVMIVVVTMMMVIMIVVMVVHL